MKNKVIYMFLTLLLFFCFSNDVSAAKVKSNCKPKNDTSKCYINTGSDADNDYIIVDKSSIKQKVSESGKITLVEYDIKNRHLQKISWNEVFSKQPSLSLYTDGNDEAYKNSDKWWANLYVCKKIKWEWIGLGSKDEGAVYSSSMLSNISADNEAWFKNFINGTDSNCWTFRVQDVPEENQIGYCQVYERLNNQIDDYIQKYSETKNSDYISDYKKVLNKIKNSCSQVMSGADYDDACVTRCITYSSDKARWDKLFSIDGVKNECGFSERLVGFVVNILKWIKYIIPVAVIILGILDFIKAIGSDKDSEMKKAQGRFIKRLIAAALIFIVPLIIVFVLEKMGFVVEGCGFIDV